MAQTPRHAHRRLRWSRRRALRARPTTASRQGANTSRSSSPTGGRPDGGTPLSADRLNHIEQGVANAQYTADHATPKSRTIATTGGLNGGRDLNVDLTIFPIYGNSEGTFCEGNDARLGDQRVPTDGSVTLAKLAQAVVDLIGSKVANDGGIPGMEKVTQAEYDAMGSGRPARLFVIVGSA